MEVALPDRARLVIERERARLQERAAELAPLRMHLRALVTEVEDEVQANARRLMEVEEMLGLAPQLPICALDEDLCGRQLREVAVEVLRGHRRAGEPIHYRQWLTLVEKTGARVGGKDPAATFLTQVSKASEVESVRPRSGLYQLRAV